MLFNLNEDLPKYSFRYSLGMDTFSFTPTMSKLLSNDTIRYKIDNIDSNIISKYVFMYNKHSIFDMFTKILNNNVCIELSSLKDIVSKCNCSFIPNNLDNYIKNNKSKSSNAIYYTSFLKSMISNITKKDFEEKDNINKSVKELYNDVISIIKYLLKLWYKFWIDYDKFINMVYTELIDIFKSKLISKLDNSNIEVCNILLTHPDRIYNLWDKKDLTLLGDCTLDNELSYSIIDNMYIVLAHDDIVDYEKDLIESYNSIQGIKYDKLFSSLLLPLNYLLFRQIKNAAPNNATRNITLNNTKSIVMLFHNIINSLNINMVNNDTYKLLNTFALPYPPLLLSIEYDNKLYKIVIDDSKDKIIGTDTIVKDLIYLSRDNIDVIECNKSNPIETILYQFDDDKEEKVNDLYNIAKDEVIKYSSNTNIKDDSSISSTLLYDKEYKEESKFKYNVRNYDFGSFYKDLYISTIDLTWYSIIMKYKNIKVDIENYLAKEAFKNMSKLFKHYISIDEQKHNIKFIVKVNIREYENLVIPQSLKTKYISYVNISTYMNYWIIDMLHSYLLSRNSNLASKPILGLEILLLGIDRYNNYLDIDDLINLDNDRERESIYKRYTYSINSPANNGCFHMIDSPFFISSSNNEDLYKTMRKYILDIISNYISKDEVIYLVNKTYNRILNFLLDKIKDNGISNTNTSFKDLKIELDYFYKDSKSTFELKYY